MNLTLSQKKEKDMKEEAKQLAKNFLSRGRSMRDLGRFSEILKEEAEYQVNNNTIGGLSNGRIV